MRSPLLQKRAMDALLDSMADANYESLGDHSQGELGMLPEQKGTEPDSTHQPSVVIPSKDLAKAPDPATAEFYKESEPEKRASLLAAPSKEFELPLKPVEEVVAEVTSDKTAAKKPSPTQLQTLERMKDGQPIHRLPGGFWIVGEAASADAWGVPLDAEDKRIPSVSVNTIRSLEGQGLIKRTMKFPQEWRDERVITDEGRQILGAAASAPAKPKSGLEVRNGEDGWELVQPDGKIVWTTATRRSAERLKRDLPTWSLLGIEPVPERADLLELKAEDERGVFTMRGKREMVETLAALLKPKKQASKTAHGNVPDPGEGNYDLEHEAHVRKEAHDWSQYAEASDNHGTVRPYDPSGDYLCGTCDMRVLPNKCSRVEGDISMTEGSCKLYHIGEPEGEPPMEKKFSKEEARYGEHKGGFGCKRCEYGGKAAAPDADGRESWCSFWGMHIMPNACCAEWEAGEESKTAAAKTLYHVTYTDKVPSIKEKGILPLQTSNWIKGPEGERYGGGEIYACDNVEDAVRWAARMDWEFNKGMGTGKISIVTFTPGKEKWKIDTADPLSQAQNKGHWLKAEASVKPEQITGAYVLDPEKVKALTQRKEVKLSAKKTKAPAVFHEELNPVIWEGEALKPKVRKHLLEMATVFISELDLDDMEVEDIELSGSNAAFTYTDESDIDLHIIVSVPKEEQDFYRDYFDTKKNLFNENHDLHIGSLPVEMYVEFTDQPPVSNGVYSLRKDEWIKFPEKLEANFEEGSVQSKIKYFTRAIADVIRSGSAKRAEKLWNRIKRYRHLGLREGGELGTENLVFKYLRNAGLLEQLHDFRVKMIDDKLSLASKEAADSPITSYGMGTPIGGTDNPTGGASDEEEEDDLVLSEQNDKNVTSSEDDEYDPYDYEAEDARLAALMDAEDDECESQARFWASEIDGVDMADALSKVGSTEESGWFAKSARPSEQKIELMQKQFKLTPEQMEEVIATDPSPNQSDFVGWIAKFLAKGAFKLPEDSEKIKGQLEKFQKFKKSPSFTFNKDIQRYDPATLFDTVEKAEAAGMGSKKEQKREEVRKGATVVVQEGDIKIFKVTEPKAAAELGSGTNWCTAAPGSGFAARYLEDGPLYIFFDAGSAVAQLHCESDQFMNRRDVCILESVTGETDYSNRMKKFLADPGMAKALSLLAAKEPKVEEWVKEHVADPEEVKKILGEAAAKEVEKNTAFEQSITDYEKELADYEEKMKVLQPKIDKYQKKYQAYQEKLDEWYNKQRNGEEAGERPKAPTGEPEVPRKPYDPRTPHSYGYGYRYRGEEEAPLGKRFKFQIRNALATGQQLPPEIEAQFAQSGVSIDLLLKYGSLFHPGKPWEPLGDAILKKVQKNSKVDKEAVDYAAKFIKGAWPAIEPYLLTKLFLVTHNMENMQTALDYAIRAKKERWPEFEDKIAKAKPGAASGYGAAEYAIRVLKKPWSDPSLNIKRKKNGRINAEECMIVGNPGEARKYAEAFFQGRRWEAFEKSALEANNLAALINYAADTLHGRMPELEEKILSGQKDAQESKGRSRYRHYTDLALDYAKKVIKGRWSEYEAKVLDYMKGDKAKSEAHYSQNKFEPSHGSNRHYYGYGRSSHMPEKVANYIMQVIGGRWPELEQVLLGRYEQYPNEWANNQYLIDGYLTTISRACQERYKDNSEVEEPEGNAAPNAGHWESKRKDERVQKHYTKFTQDAQCYWEEGEKRLVTRDPGYEAHLINELRERANPQTEDEKRNWAKDEKYVSPEDLVKMEKAPSDISYEEKEKKPSYTIWNGMWVGWYGMDPIENYVDYFLANNVDWKEGVDILELAEDIEDVRGRYSFQSRPQRRQRELPLTEQPEVEAPKPEPAMASFQASLLNKQALIDMGETPEFLPPRDDIADHLDDQMQKQLTKEVMQGVREPLNPKKKKKLPQINPNVNPDGVVASKTAEYTETDALRDAETEAWLDEVNEAEDEAKRHFMQEDYLQQEAKERGITMDELWDMMGEEYCNEFYGWAYDRLPDFTDQETRGLHGKESSEKGRVYVRFLMKDFEFGMDAVQALQFAKELSSAHPGEEVLFVIDEEGVITEDTFVNGRRVGETVEKFAFRANR